MLQGFIKPAIGALALGTVLAANAAAAYTWLPPGQYYATGREKVATPGVAPQSCDAFWNIEVTKNGQMQVLQPGAPRCGVTAYGLPWRVQITGSTTAIVRKVWYEGVNLTFCQGNLKLTLQPGGVLVLANAPMAGGCAMNATISTSASLQIVQ